MPVMGEDIARQEGSIMGARYISAVALSCLLYDHILHFNDELTDIWLNFGRRTILKSLFLLGRYCTIISVVYVAISLGGFNTEMKVQEWVNLSMYSTTLILPISCQIWIIVATIFAQLSLVGTEGESKSGIVIYRLRSLWHFNRTIRRAIVAMFVVVFISSATTASIEAARLKDFFRPIPGLPGCLLTSSSAESAAYLALGLAFVLWDIFNICIFTFNTFATPYLYSSEVLKRFKRNGGRYFVYFLVVHFLFVLTVAFGKYSRFSTVPLVGALTTVINARIFYGIALEAEQYADDYYNIALTKITSQ